MNVWARYASALDRFPFRTQMASSAVIWFAGDVVAQRMAQRMAQSPGRDASPFDITRSLHHAWFGGLVEGTAGHVWYKQLDLWANRWFARGSSRFIAAKVAMDGLVFGPLHTGGYMGVMSMIEGATVEEAIETVREKFRDAYLVELLGWSVVQALNFRFVPVTYHLLVVNCVTVADVAFVSWWLKYRAPATQLRS
jgi:protein Mpv17